MIAATPNPTGPLTGLDADIRRWAIELGFAGSGIANLQLDDDLDHLQRWIADGLHGGMAYMARDPAQRAHPPRLRPGTLSVISLRMNYRPTAADARGVLDDPQRAYIARYALGRDYHRVMRGRLLKLAARIEAAVGPYGYRVLTDSAPALEKALARNAGLGWIGKNTLLLDRDLGSMFFLGEIYTDLPLTPSGAGAAKDGCGRCQACLKVCPTQAFVGPYRLDARRCISYLTIEHHGPIPTELRPLIGNRIFGCDDCQLICPWNRYARISAEPDFAPRHGLDAARLTELFAWNQDEWLRRTEGMALRRAGYARWLRNLAVALGNAAPSADAVAALQSRRASSDEVLCEHIDWAIARQRSAANGQRPATAQDSAAP